MLEIEKKTSNQYYYQILFEYNKNKKNLILLT